MTAGTQAALRRPTAPARLTAALETRSRPVLMLLAWGLVVAVLGGLALSVSAPADWPLQASRSSGLRDSLTMLNHGGPLLLGRHGGTGALYAVGAGDDLGIYVYLPWLAHTLGVGDPVSLIRYCYAAMFGVTALLYPLWFWRLTGSMLAALVAPIVLLCCVVSLGFQDIYWLPAWASLTLLPPLLIIAEHRGSRAWLGLVAVALVAGWLQTMRSESGLGALLGAVIVLITLRLRWWRTLLVLVAIAVAYVAIGSFGITAIQHHRDRIVGTQLSNGQSQAHPFWHPMYLGLGYLPNNYGIRFKDGIAAARVQHDAPGTVYLSPAYENVLRRAYFKVVRTHPLEVIGQYAAKAWVTLADTAPYLLLVALTLPLLLGSRRRRQVRRWVVIMAPSLLITFLPALVAIPLQAYEQGLDATVGLVAILGIALTVAALGEAVTAEGALRPALRRPLDALAACVASPTSRRALSVAGVAAALIVLIVSAHFIRQTSERWEGQSSGVLIDLVQAQERPA